MRPIRVIRAIRGKKIFTKIQENPLLIPNRPLLFLPATAKRNE